MVMATSTAIALAAAAAAAGGSYYNTQQTAKHQDEAAADSIRNQSLLQKQADAKVNDTVHDLQGSTSADAKAQRLDDYLNVLRANKGKQEQGLTPNIGSQTFQTDSTVRAANSDDYAAKTAGLMARMDAPQIQRQNEGFGYGNLATDLNLVGRQAQGQSFLDQLRLNAIRRNAKIDLASSLLMSGAGAAYGAGGAAAGGLSTGGQYASAGGNGAGDGGYGMMRGNY